MKLPQQVGVGIHVNSQVGHSQISQLSHLATTPGRNAQVNISNDLLSVM